MSHDEEPVIIRDNRKIDPLTGEVRKAAPAEGDTSTGESVDEAGLEDANALLLAERTADLQRLQAEYANYRKRADRERLAAGEVAIGTLVTVTCTPDGKTR